MIYKRRPILLWWVLGIQSITRWNQVSKGQEVQGYKGQISLLHVLIGLTHLCRTGNATFSHVPGCDRSNEDSVRKPGREQDSMHFYLPGDILRLHF